MRTIILIPALLILVSEIYSQTTSTIIYDAGSSIEVQAGADVCATSIIINGTYSGTGTICLGALPVSIISFTSTTSQRNVTLTWITEWELNNKGFDVERTAVNQGEAEYWQKVASITGNGTTNNQVSYSYTDSKLPKGEFKYRLKQIDFNGNYEYFALADIVTIAPPNEFSMGQNYPNPGNPKTKIDYELPFNAIVKIIIYNMLGEEVAIIVNEQKEAGYYSAEFNGSNLASGVYFYRINVKDISSSANFTKTMKMILVK